MTSCFTWTWISGNSDYNKPSSASDLGTRQGAISWIGNDGNFYVFGGERVSGTSQGQLNDLWRYNPTSDQWTFLKGTLSTNQNGVYGTLNTPSSMNQPGGRTQAAVWKTNNNRIYVFGGIGFHQTSTAAEELADLWVFDHNTNNWTWIKGPQNYSPAILKCTKFGTQGIYNSDNQPGSRRNATSWMGADQKLYLFGGYGIVCNEITASLLNELWVFNTSDQNWAWLHGTANQQNTPGIYNSDLTLNSPGAREGATGWVGSDGLLYLFGGYGVGAAGTPGQLNDLWRYNPSNNQWTFLKGRSDVGSGGSYGTKCVEHQNNLPPVRQNASAWIDNFGDLCLFGGNTSSPSTGKFEDLWCYNINSNNWTWVGGTSALNTAPVYGTKKQRGASNQPGGLTQAVTWQNNNQLYVLSGSINPNEQTNTLWRKDDYVFTVEIQASDTYGSPIVATPGIPTVLSITPNDGFEPFTYNWNGGQGVGSTFTVNPTVQTTYSVVVTDATGCTASDLITIYISSDLKVKIIGHPYFCRNSFTQLTAVIPSDLGGTPPYQYLWSPGGSSDVAIYVSDAKTYTITVTDAEGRVASDHIPVSDGSFNVAITGGTFFCGSGTITAVPTGSPGPFTYSWLPNGETTAAITVSSTSDYSVTVTNTVSGCAEAQSSLVTISPPITDVSISGSSDICSNDTAHLAVNVVGGAGPFTYSWTPNIGNTSNVTFSPTITSDYVVTVTGGACSVTSAPFHVRVKPLPTVTISGSSDICANSPAHLVVNVVGGVGPFTYSWTPNIGNTSDVTFFPTITGDYAVTVTGAGCSVTSAPFHVRVHPLPIVTIAGNLSVLSGQSTTLTANVTNDLPPYTYLWNTGSSDSSITVAPTSDTAYSVTVTNSLGCYTTASEIVYIVQFFPSSTGSYKLTCCQCESDLALIIYSDISFYISSNTLRIANLLGNCGTIFSDLIPVIEKGGVQNFDYIQLFNSDNTSALYRALNCQEEKAMITSNYQLICCNNKLFFGVSGNLASDITHIPGTNSDLICFVLKTSDLAGCSDCQSSVSLIVCGSDAAHYQNLNKILILQD